MINFLFVLLSCTSSSNSNNEVDDKKLSNLEKLEKLYTTKVSPLFNGFANVDIPKEFKVDKSDTTVNAGAAFGYVEVSQGLVDYEKEDIQLFVLAHELGHIVTLKQAAVFGLANQIPSGANTNDYKKAEYLADLIAINLLKNKLPDDLEELEKDFTVLQNLLGGETFTHPSGLDRISFIKTFLAESSVNSDAFKKFFTEIWERD